MDNNSVKLPTEPPKGSLVGRIYRNAYVRYLFFGLVICLLPLLAKSGIMPGSFLINLGGVNVMAKVQKYGTWLLIGGLMLFIIAGLFQIKYPAIFDVMADDFMASGSKGFTSAIATFMYSTVGYSLLMTSCLAFVYFLAFYLLPTKYPEAWATMHVPNGVYYGIVTVALAVQLYIFYNACRNLTAKTVIISLVAMVVCMAYGFIRAKSPSVQIKTSTWEE